MRSLGIEDVRIHDVRHTGPSALLMQGIPGDVVRKITGHRSRELERYQHQSNAGLMRAPLPGGDATRAAGARSGAFPCAAAAVHPPRRDR
jgi:integrase